MVPEERVIEGGLYSESNLFKIENYSILRSLSSSEYINTFWKESDQN